jgi:hypothetical protein
MGDSPDKEPTEKLHPLIEPRFVGALGIVAFGGGVGLALMLARILLIWGLTISLLCAATVIWIYAEHFRAAYRALKRREPYSGAPPKELVAVIVMLVFLVPISLSVYFSMSKEEESINRPIMDIYNVVRNKVYDDKDNRISVIVTNVGNIAAKKTNFLALGVITEKQLEKETIRDKLNSMVNVLREIDSQFEIDNNQMQPSSGYRITIQSADVDELLTLYEKGEQKPFLLSDEDAKRLKDGSIYIYIFFAGTFSDAILSDKAYWAYGSCRFYAQNLFSPTNCWYDHNMKVLENRFD